MPTEVLGRVTVLARTGQVGMYFTNMRNEAYPDAENGDASESDDDSDDDDPDYSGDDDSSDSDDDDYDDFIAGVNGLLLRILRSKKRMKVSRTPTTTKQSMTI